MENQKYFGVMLDMSRNAVMKPSEVKNFANILKKMGYNMIQLYTEETYEVDNEPYFGYMRGRYTQAELQDIVAYCESIGVEVIPCIQTLAHLDRIFRWKPYHSINDCGDILLVGDEELTSLLKIYSARCANVSVRNTYISVWTKRICWGLENIWNSTVLKTVLKF